MSEYIVCGDDFEESYYRYTDIKPETMFGHRLREEIVRCKSCKYYDQNDAPSDVYPDRYWCDRMTLYMPTDGFCSFGKRKVVGE